MAYSEVDLQNALKALRTTKNLSIRKAARDHGVPMSTLRARHHRVNQPRSVAHEARQLLSKVQEDKLAQWVLTEQAIGRPPSHKDIKEFATQILRAAGSDHAVGKRWINRFMDRNPVLRARRTLRTDSARVNEATDEPATTPVAPEAPDATLLPPGVVITTPKKTKDVYMLLNYITSDSVSNPTQRVIKRKIIKACDQLSFRVAQLQRETEALRAQLEAARLHQRRTAQEEPNELSADPIQEDQTDADCIEEVAGEGSDAESTVSGDSCIVVASSRS